MKINNLIKKVYENAVEKGFYCKVCGGAGFGMYNNEKQTECIKCNATGIDQNKNIPKLLIMIVGEIVEAVKAKISIKVRRLK